MAVASSAATSLAASNSVTTTTQSAPQQQQQHMLSPVQMPSQQPLQNVAPTLQQVVIPQQSQQQQGLMQMPPCISSATFGPVTTTTTTTTHAVRSSYKPIAPAPPQQQQQQQQPNQPPNLLAMAPHPHQVNASNDKTDQQHPQILTIPVGSAVYPIGMTGTHSIRSATPMNNFQSMNGDLGQHQHGQLNIHMPMSSSQSNTTCFITNPAVTSAARMSTPLGGGLITVGPAAPLSAMANMTHAVPPSSSPITISTQGPRLPSLQPVTVTVSASPAPQFPLPSPARTQSSTTPLLSTTEKVEEPKQSPRNIVTDSQTPSAPTTTTSAVEEPSTEKKETPQMNGTADHHMVNHSPAIREKKEPNLPQAVVRPQILTHVLGDFVIQESSEPFPVGRFHPNESLTRCNGQRNQDNSFKLDGEPPSKFIFLIIYVLLYCMYSFSKMWLLMTPISPLNREKITYGTTYSDPSVSTSGTPACAAYHHND